MVYFWLLNSFLMLYCVVNCGDFIQNEVFGIMGIIGMFGEIFDIINRNMIYVVVLIFLYVIWVGNVVFLKIGERIGECIWLDRFLRNIFDIFIIKIDFFVVYLL